MIRNKKLSEGWNRVMTLLSFIGIVSSLIFGFTVWSRWRLSGEYREEDVGGFIYLLIISIMLPYLISVIITGIIVPVGRWIYEGFKERK
jgi:ACR3 family arsenite efflux pump ArsB